MIVRTVGDLIAELQKLPKDLPVLAGCHYDNDDGLTNNVSVHTSYVAHQEDRFYMEVDPGWGYTNMFLAVTIA